MKTADLANQIANDVSVRLKQIIREILDSPDELENAAFAGAARGIQYHNSSKKSDLATYATKAAEKELCEHLGKLLSIYLFNKNRFGGDHNDN